MADLKDARYAPGDYLCTCIECGSQFAGDKRASRCKSCATLVLRIAELEAAMREAIETFETIAMGPADPNDGHNHARNNIVLARHGAARARLVVPT